MYLECAEEEQLVLWFSSRQLDAERSLASYVGTNEKSKLVIRLTAPGASGPPLPRTVDPATKDLIDKVQESRLLIVSHKSDGKGPSSFFRIAWNRVQILAKFWQLNAYSLFLTIQLSVYSNLVGWSLQQKRLHKISKDFIIILLQKNKPF